MSEATIDPATAVELKKQIDPTQESSRKSDTKLLTMPNKSKPTERDEKRNMPKFILNVSTEASHYSIPFDVMEDAPKCEDGHILRIVTRLGKKMAWHYFPLNKLRSIYVEE